MAAPHVAATAAIMLEEFLGLDYDDIRDAILTTAVDLTPAGYDFDTGYGRLAAFWAVVYIQEVLAVAASPTADQQLLRASPNPFQNQVQIDLAHRPAALGLEILDVLGRRVRRLGPSAAQAGVPALPAVQRSSASRAPLLAGSISMSWPARLAHNSMT